MKTLNKAAWIITAIYLLAVVVAGTIAIVRALL